MEKLVDISGMAGYGTQAMSGGLCHAQIGLCCIPSQAGKKDGLSSLVCFPLTIPTTLKSPFST